MLRELADEGFAILQDARGFAWLRLVAVGCLSTAAPEGPRATALGTSRQWFWSVVRSLVVPRSTDVDSCIQEPRIPFLLLTAC